MTYTPRPLDAGDPNIPSGLQPILERLAADAHDTWAHKRIAEGWTFGAEKDPVRKKTPFLIPYHDLPESEKETDREVVRRVIAGMLKLGCRIEPPTARS